MKTYVVLLAGGKGLRMNSSTAKQFIEIDGVPLIVYTLRNFEASERIDEVVVVCNEDYVALMNQILRDYHLEKVTHVVLGGATGHDSARNGVFALKGIANENDLVVIHDAARPILPQWVINDMIDVAADKGNACSSIPMNETIIITDDQRSGDAEVDRAHVRRVQTPQAYRFALISSLYEQAERDGRHDFVYANTMAIHYGVRLYFSQGFANNIKITRPEDILLFRALHSLEEKDLR